MFFLIARKLLRKPTREELRLEQIRPRVGRGTGTGPRSVRFVDPGLGRANPRVGEGTSGVRVVAPPGGHVLPRTSETIYALRFLLLMGPLVVAGVCAIFADSSRTIPISDRGRHSRSARLAVLPRMYVFFRRRRRMQRIREALPDTLDMLSMCVSGGLELGDSLDHVARRLTGYPECAQELMLLKRHAELGSLRRALSDFAKRVDLPETDQLAGLLLRGSHLGTELVGSLAQQAEHLRVARRQSAAVRANKTPVKTGLSHHASVSPRPP